MGKRTKPRIVGVAGTLANGTWGLYSAFTTAASLPADAGWAARMLADPPIYLPWLAFVVCVGIAAWAFWPRPDNSEQSEGTNTGTNGPNSPNLTGTFNGPVHIGSPLPSVGRVDINLPGVEGATIHGNRHYGLGPGDSGVRVGKDSVVSDNEYHRSDKPDITYNITNSGSGFALGHGTVNIGRPRFEMTDDLMSEIAAKLDSGKPVTVGSSDYGQSRQMADRLRDFLLGNGFPNGGRIVVNIPCEHPVTIFPNGIRNGLTSFGGTNQAVYVDSSVS